MSLLEKYRDEIRAEKAAARGEPVEKPEPEVVEDENLEAEEPEVVEAVDAEDEEVEESAEEEESEDFELSLDDEEDDKPKKPTPEEALLHKLTKEKRKRKEAKEAEEAAQSEVEELRKTVEALKAQIGGAKPQPKPAPKGGTLADQYGYPPIPVISDPEIDYSSEKYRIAYQKWTEECKRIDQAKVQREQANQSRVQAQQEAAQKLAERSSRFIKENRIKAEKATDMIQAGVEGIDSVLGEGAALDLLNIIGEGSERIAYYAGQKPEVLAKIKELNDKDGGRGLMVTRYLTDLSNKLQRKQKHISKAPEPDEPLKGDGSSAKAGKLQAAYDKETDVSKLRAIRKRARELGIELKR